MAHSCGTGCALAGVLCGCVGVGGWGSGARGEGEVGGYDGWMYQGNGRVDTIGGWMCWEEEADGSAGREWECHVMFSGMWDEHCV